MSEIAELAQLLKEEVMRLKESGIYYLPKAHRSVDLVFVGEAMEPEADRLLTKMIEAMGYRREDVVVCSELELDSQRPKIIVALGRPDLLRGHWTSYQGIDLMPTFHPAELLKSPEKKREAWEDLKTVMKRL